MAKINVRRVFVMILLLLLTVGLCACSFPQPKPEEGVWYCEELMVELDFGMLNEGLRNEAVNPPYYAKKYNADGSYQEIRCHFDYGNGIYLISTDWKEDYLNGRFKYQKGVFKVKSIQTGHTYIFERIDD